MPKVSHMDWRVDWYWFGTSHNLNFVDKVIHTYERKHLGIAVESRCCLLCFYKYFCRLAGSSMPTLDVWIVGEAYSHPLGTWLWCSCVNALQWIWRLWAQHGHQTHHSRQPVICGEKKEISPQSQADPPPVNHLSEGALEVGTAWGWRCTH